jgi:hypothetical protein
MMLTRFAIWSLGAVALSATIIVAQARPDFSGVWTPVHVSDSRPAPTAPAGGPHPPPPPRTLSATITQSPTEMKLERLMETAGRESTVTFVYKLDGTESVNRMGPIEFRTTAAWDADALVLSSVASADGNHLGELREVYTFENGDLVVESVRNAPVGTFRARTVHKKG